MVTLTREPMPDQEVASPSDMGPARSWPQWVWRLLGRGSVTGAAVAWVATGGLQPLTLDSVAGLAGLLAAVLVCLQVALMARIPFLERAYGQPQLARVHRCVGVAFLGLMTAHIALTTLAHADGRLMKALTGLAQFIGSVPAIAMAAIASVTFVFAAVSSAQFLRDRLGYERWHALHTSSYLALGLSIPHALAFGSTLRTSVWAKDVLVALVVAVYGLVITFRVGIPAYQYCIYRPEFYKAEHDTDGHHTSIYIHGGEGRRTNLGELGYRSGHFAIVRFIVQGHWYEAHPWSVSSTPQSNELRFTVVDPDHRWFDLLRNKTIPVVLEGPFGRFPYYMDTTAKIAFFASGIGVTPLRAMLEDLPEDSNAVFVYRVDQRTTAPLRHEVAEMATARHARLLWFEGPRGETQKGKHGEIRTGWSWLPKLHQHGRSDVHNLLLDIPDITQRELFLVGPPGWMDAVERAALRAGVPREKIHIERFTW